MNRPAGTPGILVIADDGPQSRATIKALDRTGVPYHIRHRPPDDPGPCPRVQAPGLGLDWAGYRPDMLERVRDDGRRHHAGRCRKR